MPTHRNRTSHRRPSESPFEKFQQNRANDRRPAILTAFWRVVLKKGYSAATLSSIAREARISTSHLLYYFRSKEALISELYDAYSRASRSQMRSNRELPPEERCRVWVENMFLESAAPSWDQRIILDMLGHASHSSSFRRTLEKDSQANAAYLRDLFLHTPNSSGLSSRDLAALVQVLWTGFIVMSFIYPPLDKSRSRSLFRQVVMKLAGLEAQKGRGKTSRLKRGAQKRPTRNLSARLLNGSGLPASSAD